MIKRTDIYWLFVYIIGFLCTIIFANASILVMLVLLSLPVLYISNSSYERKLTATIFATGLLFSIILYFYYDAAFGAPYFNELPSDDHSYELDAMTIAANAPWYKFFGLTEILGGAHNSPGYVYTVSLLVRISSFFGGFHTLLPKILNLMVHSIGTIFLYRILVKAHGVDQVVSRVISYTYGLFPYILFLSIHTFRDVIIASAFITIYYFFIIQGNSKWKNRRNIILTILILIFISQLRLFSSVVMLGIIYVCMRNNNSTSKFFNNATSLSIILGLVYFLFFYDNIYLYDSYFEYLIGKQEQYSEYRAGLASNSGISVIIFSLPILPFGWAIRGIYLMINPLPFLNFELTNLYISFGTIVQIYLYLIIFVGYVKVGLIHKWLNYFMWALLISISMTSFQLRHLTMIYPFLFIISAIYINYFRQHNITYKKYLLFFTILMGIVPVLYLIRIVAL